jgi:hypothetical protein
MLIALKLKLLLNIILHIYIYKIIVKWSFKKYKINFDVITPFNAYFKLPNNVTTLKIYLCTQEGVTNNRQRYKGR